jgi:hypothetical protein
MDSGGLPDYSGFVASSAERPVGPRDFKFEACSGFTRVAARRLVDPPTVGRCIKRLRPVGCPSDHLSSLRLSGRLSLAQYLVGDRCVRNLQPYILGGAGTTG